MKQRYWIGIGIFSLFMGSLAFWDSDAQVLGGLINGVLAIASILFGILGVWMSMLKPVDELDAAAREKSSSKTDLALKLSPALKQATFALAAVVLLRLLLSAAPGMNETLLELIRLLWPRWEYPELLSPILRSLFGACVTFVYIFETVILLITLLPMLSVESKRRQLEFDEEEANDPASQYARSRR